MIRNRGGRGSGGSASGRGGGSGGGRGGGRSGGRGGGHSVGAGLLGEGPGVTTGMRLMMSDNRGGEAGLLGKAPNQGRMSGNQGRMPQRHDEQMNAPPRPPRSLLDTPNEEQHYSLDTRDRDPYRSDTHYINDDDYYNERQHDDRTSYMEDRHYDESYDRNIYDDHDGRDRYGHSEPDLDYGRGPAPNNAGRSHMNVGRQKPLIDRAPVDDRSKKSRWNSPSGLDDMIDHPSRRELMEKASNQVRMQQSPRSLLDTPVGGQRDQHGPRNDYNNQEYDDRGLYEEPRQRRGILDDDTFGQRYEQSYQNLPMSGHKQVSPRSERRSRFDEPRSQHDSRSQQMSQPKSKQRDLMEKAEMQMKLLEEEKRMQEVERERMMLQQQQQQQALLLQQQQMQLQQIQQQKMQMMQQQAGLLGSMPAMMGNPQTQQGQGSMGSIPSLFDVPVGGKTNLGKRTSATSRNQDNKKPRKMVLVEVKQTVMTRIQEVVIEVVEMM
ncbi:hypothetical protein ACF0H5_021867 [Mactra antiquata]